MTANLLVTSQFDKTVREYNGTTGEFVKVAASGGALGDPLGLVLGLDGNPLGSGGLYTPSAMAFGPDGNLYISGGTFGGNLGVRRYDPTTGAFINLFANTGSDLYVPIGIAFGPDDNLYVATQNKANVMRFNYPTGTFMDFFVPDGGGGLTAPFHLTFGAGPGLTLTYTLHRDCLHNVDDPGMRWQIEGGKVRQARRQLLQREAVELRNNGAGHCPAVGYALLPRWEAAREHHPAWCP